MANYKIIGQDVAPPPDLIAKVTGQAKYSEDFRAEGMLFAKLLLSPMPHARVLNIDASDALALQGVEAMLTADELPGDPGSGDPALTSEPLYAGQPILAVAAVDETTAAAAIERIRLDLEPLPFVVDPLESLRPGGPNARAEGNVYIDREIQTLKWTEEDFARARPDGFPRGEPTTEWTLGDLEAGFAQADLILEEVFVHQSTTHHPLEPRTAMAYWQNGKLYLHASTQSVQRTRVSMAEDLGLDPADLVLIGEYCGGGFGSKISGSVIHQVPALLAKKTGRPVMLRVTRAEENAYGRGRAGFQGWVRMGWRSDGRVTAIDLYIVQDNGPYSRQGDFTTASAVASLAYQPLSMRFRGVPVLTNTPPRSAQRGPGGVQATAILEPLMDKAAGQLNVDRLEIRRVNAPGHDGWIGSSQSPISSSFARQAIDRGAEVFGWEEKKQLSRQRRGSKVTGIGVGFGPFVGGSSGFDGLLLIRPDGNVYIHQGIGNLGTHSFNDTARPAAEVLGVPWDRCEIVWGNTAKHLPWSSSQSGSQTTHAHTRANYVAAMAAKRKLQEIAARDLGGSPDDYEIAEERVYRRSSPATGMSLAQAAERAIELGGTYSGHELPEDIHEITVASAQALAGQGLLAAAKDALPHDASTWSFVIGLALVEVDVETGQVDLLEYTASTDCGTVMNPTGLPAQLHGGGVQGFGIGHSERWVIDPQWGIGLVKGLEAAKPPTILDVPLAMQWAATNEPDPLNPVGAKGIGEAPMSAGSAALQSAILDAMGGVYLGRSPLMAEQILAFFEEQKRPYGRLEAHV